MTYQVSQSWQILATYYDSRTGSWTPLTVISPLTPPIATLVPALQERGAFLTIRYRRASGLHFAPLGGPPGAGSGELAGIVYLDANDNGHCDAGERRTQCHRGAGRTILGSEPMSGRFDFPVVATGHHVISVVSDNVPLPWALSTRRAGTTLNPRSSAGNERRAAAAACIGVAGAAVLADAA